MDPEHLNLRQLRIELKKMGLSPSGSKAELLKRFKMAIGPDSESFSRGGDSGFGTSKASKLAKLKARYASGFHRDDSRSSNKRKRMGPQSVLLTEGGTEEGQEVEEFFLSEDDPDLYPEDEDESDDEESQAIQNFLERRKMIGLSEEEIERRRRARFEFNPPSTNPKQKRRIVENSAFSPTNINESELDPDVIIANTRQAFFFEKASMELERVSLQNEVVELETKVDQLQNELEAKDRLIRALQSCIYEKDETMKAVQNANVPQELLRNWLALHQFFSAVKSSS